ncbi:hypothetical protein N1F78_00920 [Seonamhaeicola sp. MEBiC1930]|uniref:hypothetical protein n=1 Tax=Seonamhaeicola sp. MEBiC01930 TaxID=2976768 RepID=UPI0032549115
MKALNYILKSIGYNPNPNMWDKILEEEMKYRKDFFIVYNTRFAQILFDLPFDEEKLSNGITWEEHRRREKKRMREHEEWLKEQSRIYEEEKKMLALFAEQKIFDFPFKKDKHGKVNLDNKNTESKAKLHFQLESFCLLIEKGLIGCGLNEFRLMPYEDVIARLEFAKTMDNNPNTLADAKMKFGEDFEFYESEPKTEEEHKTEWDGFRHELKASMDYWKNERKRLRDNPRPKFYC